jgi:hypothetical protein
MWCIPVLVAAALAADPPPDPSPTTETETPEDPRIDALDAELNALRERLDQMELDAFLREAEALAAQAPQTPPPLPSSPSAYNPAITAFGDVLTSVGVQNGAVMAESGPWIRRLELDIRAAVDPYAQAVAVLAVEQESPVGLALEGEPPDGSFGVAAEELYVDFVALPAGLSLRAGGFRQPFGITNRAHPHDYPWTDTPMPLMELLGEEGLNDVGGLVIWRIPNRAGVGLTLEGGANAGSRFDEGGTTAAPAGIGRGEVFVAPGNLQLAAGGSVTGGGAGGHVAGGDLMVRWRANNWRSVVLMAEALTDGDAFGSYAALQLQPFRMLYVGGRVDQLDDALRAGGFLSFYTSEFLRLRGGAMAGDGTVVADAQLTFVWGSHPVEPYRVNR